MMTLTRQVPASPHCILKMISRHQYQLQVPACRGAFRCLFALQQIPMNCPLIRRRPAQRPARLPRWRLSE